MEERARLTDAVRLRRLRETGLLEDGCCPSLDRLASAAAQQAGAPVALVTMVDADRQVFASQVGLGEPWASRGGTPMSHSFCQYVVIDNAPLIVPDARADPRLRDNLAIDDLRVAAYAGYPLHAPDGTVLGSFCVIDTVPRDWTPQELSIVRTLATSAETEIALRTANRNLRLATERTNRVLDTAHDAFVSTDADGVILAWNTAAATLFGYPAAEAIGRPVGELILPARFRAAHEAGLRRVRDTGVSILSGQRLELAAVDRSGREFPIEMTLQVVAEDTLICHAFLHDITDRKAAGQRADDDRTFLHTLLDSLDTGVAACDAEGRLVLRNSALRALYEPGEEPAAVASLTAAGRLYDPDGRRPLEPDEVPLARAYAGEHVDGQDVTVRAADGRRRRFVANARPITTADGRHLGAVAALHDVTDQHRAATLQQTQHAVARALADATTAEQAATGTVAAIAGALGWTCGEFWRTDDESGLISRVGHWTEPGHPLPAVTNDKPFVLPRGTGLAGIVWETGAELWVPELADDPRTAVRRDEARAAGLRTAVGLPVRSDDRVLGVLLFLSTTVEKPDAELLTMLDGVCAHLGRHLERRRAEELTQVLAATQRAFDRVVAQVNDYVWTYAIEDDGRPVVVYASPDSHGILGAQLPAGTDIAKTMAENVHPDDMPAMARLRDKVFGGEPADAEVRLLGLDGVTRWVWIRSVPRPEGGRLYIDGIATDVTARRELADRREQVLHDQQQQNRRLRELDRLKDELVALVSHELRNPLATIRGYTEMLLDDAGLTGDHRHLASVIDKHSAHMQGLVDDLLDTARIDAGQMKLEPRPLSLIRLVVDSVDARRPDATAKDIAIEVDVARHLPAHADPVRLRQVLDNLISNAVKYTPQGGTVTLTGRHDDATATTTLRVTDTGIGIPAEQRTHLFDRFFRASNAVSQGIKGTGLGLAISKAIIDAHHGGLTAEPAGPDGGTTFTVTVPSCPPPER
ncbi:PAS domain S-box protein [Actinoplanes sp. NPDC048967]|uniref:PAS domain-containing sensor histidine kinase n=1 Tax=Actinoplanes sp. NPDC048967 TaxID=3155269 RepID=UPI0033E25553